MSRSNFYKERRKRARKQVEEGLIVELVQAERKRQPRLGARKLLHRLGAELKEAGIQIGRDRFLDVLQRNDLLVEPLRSSFATTGSRHRFKVYTNLYRDLPVERIHQVWLSDMTYIRTQQGFVFLSLVSDACSRKIIGYRVSESLESKATLQALRQALRQLPEGHYPIHHSDRGIQYCCRDYVATLQKNGIDISMTERNHCYENAQAERLNGILKQEYSLGATFRTKQQAAQAVHQAVTLYNECRPHSSLGLATPALAHTMAA